MKIGEYCRTDKGKIGKIVHFEPRDKYPYSYDRVILDTEGHKRTTRNIIKCSPNIIDLIEVGDYVNGLKVTGIGGTYHGRKDKAIRCDYCVNKETGKWTMIYDDEIKSILTKEQFESMEYKVKE
jgi:hypothetical protein